MVLTGTYQQAQTCPADMPSISCPCTITRTPQHYDPYLCTVSAFTHLIGVVEAVIHESRDEGCFTNCRKTHTTL